MKEVIVQAYVREEKLKTGLTISFEKKYTLPVPLQAGKDDAFDLEVRLNRPPTPKDAKAVKEEEVEADGSILFSVNGKMIVEEKKLRYQARVRL